MNNKKWLHSPNIAPQFLNIEREICEDIAGCGFDCASNDNRHFVLFCIMRSSKSQNYDNMNLPYNNTAAETKRLCLQSAAYYFL